MRRLWTRLVFNLCALPSLYMLVSVWSRWDSAPHQVGYCSSPTAPVTDSFLFPLVFTSSFLFRFFHLDFWFPCFDFKMRHKIHAQRLDATGREKSWSNRRRRNSTKPDEVHWVRFWDYLGNFEPILLKVMLFCLFDS
jgi:hypothetical protein